MITKNFVNDFEPFTWLKPNQNGYYAIFKARFTPYTLPELHKFWIIRDLDKLDES